MLRISVKDCDHRSHPDVWSNNDRQHRIKPLNIVLKLTNHELPKGSEIRCSWHTCGTRHDLPKSTGNQSCVTVGEQTLQHMWHSSVKFVNNVWMTTRCVFELQCENEMWLTDIQTGEGEFQYLRGWKYSIRIEKPLLLIPTERCTQETFWWCLRWDDPFGLVCCMTKEATNYCQTQHCGILKISTRWIVLRPGNTTPKYPSPRNTFSNHQSPRNKIANHQSPGNKQPNHQSPRNNILITNHQEIKYSLDICPICHIAYIYVPYCIA